MGPLPIDSTSATPPASTSLSPRQEIEKKLQSLAAQANETPSGNTITQEELIEPLQRINEVMRPRGLEFDISEGSSRIITRVVDRDTGDVIRQIPAEEVLLLAEQLEEMQGRLISVEA
ncbi:MULTISPECIES: flagellar protein FlaG [unclassified Halomonas]|uniref:flagellar protein FlaG n=1 Tax=unclassified Halomonas TaxID=2609666 RepID=UPI0009906BBA|nr:MULTISPECIES: flagellar protein FlaG [unclassified Halomonas]AQU84593.1 flagellar protein [Halomonas sp. 'Soap Lake \